MARIAAEIENRLSEIESRVADILSNVDDLKTKVDRGSKNPYNDLDDLAD